MEHLSSGCPLTGKLGLTVEMSRNSTVVSTQALVFTGLAAWSLLQAGVRGE
jgi:hypothetical protein